jgi:hypothetical protein
MDFDVTSSLLPADHKTLLRPAARCLYIIEKENEFVWQENFGVKVG